jgi:uncharacterized protein
MGTIHDIGLSGAGRAPYISPFWKEDIDGQSDTGNDDRMIGSDQEMIRVMSTKYDGSPHNEWPAQLISSTGTEIRIHVSPGTEELVRGYQLRRIKDGFIGWYWTDRWYNIWQFEPEHSPAFYANVSLPCKLKGYILHWVDMDLDVLQTPDGTLSIKDQDEFDRNCSRMGYPRDVIAHALEARDEIVALAQKRQLPFQCTGRRLPEMGTA